MYIFIGIIPSILLCISSNIVESVTNIEQVVPSLFALFYGVIIIITIIFMTIRIHWSIPILLFIGLIPLVYTKSKTETDSKF